MDIATVIGGASLLTAIGFGLYQFRKQREADRQRKEMENRLQRKEDLEELSNDLRGLRNRIVSLCEETVNPHVNEDTDLLLHDFGRDVLAYHYSTGENPTVKVKEISLYQKGDRDDIILNDVTEVVDAYNQDAKFSLIQADIHIDRSSDVLRFSVSRNINESLKGVQFVKAQLLEIKEEHESLMNQFDSTLLEEIDDILDDLIIGCYKKLFENYGGVEFDPRDYDTPVELEDDIYRTFILSDGVHEVIDRLEKLADRVDNIQSTVVSTSFS